MSRARDLSSIPDGTGGLTLGGDLTLDTNGIYLGGTGSANYLDDYEEGTWTPIYSASGTAPVITGYNSSGYYTKVGDLVFASFGIETTGITSQGANNLTIGGLPFIGKSGSNLSSPSGGLSVTFSSNWNADNTPISGLAVAESRVFLIKFSSADPRDGTTFVSAGNLSTSNPGNTVRGTIVYKTN